MAPVSPIRSFLAEIDRMWRPHSPEPIILRLIGSTALMLQVAYHRGTKDSDVLKAAPLSEEIQRRLLDLAGPGTSLQRRHGLYLDFVAPGIPFLPRPPQFHPVEGFEPPLAHFSIEALDVVDTVVSKLKRFSANDLDDIRAMVESGLVPPDRLRERFLSAMDGFSMDARAEHLPVYIQNLHQVERDLLMVEESRIDLPTWMDEGD